MGTSHLARRRAASLTVLATIGALLGGAGPALAMDATDNTATCWLDADTGAYACFGNYEAFAEASMIVAESDGIAPYAIQPYATYTLAIFYEDASYGGSTTYITTSNSSLCSGYHYYGSSMPSGWNDRVSSFRAFGTCKVKLWKDSGYGGSTYGPYASATSIGTMNDEASSYQIYAP